VVSHKSLVGRFAAASSASRFNSNRKTREKGPAIPDRDCLSSNHINTQVSDFQAAGQPSHLGRHQERKELVWRFSGTGGRELRPKGEPERVRCTTSRSPNLGKVSALRDSMTFAGEHTAGFNVGIDTIKTAGLRGREHPTLVVCGFRPATSYFRRHPGC